MTRRKVINDPVYGFLSIQSEIVFQIVEHPYFQRLRRVAQLGLTGFVYPGALHTRFHHALGACHLMQRALDALRAKGHSINEQEYEAATVAILLHDVGHGPFSHALESTIMPGISHEQLSLMIMEKLDQVFDGRLQMAMQMFTDHYPRKFFHQLISSQLDMDRLDYLQRDYFFTGVVEGKIGLDRIIWMLDIAEDQIVVEEKGIYSIENFLTARRLMYWQVYMHKTTVSTEQMLKQLIARARYLIQAGQELVATPALKAFLSRGNDPISLKTAPSIIDNFLLLDDYDIWGSLKFWLNHSDKVLSLLSQMLLNRKLFRAVLTNAPPDPRLITETKSKVEQHFNISAEEADFFCTTGSISNAAYVTDAQRILIRRKNGQIEDIASASDLPNIEALGKIVKKYYLCYPKNLSL